MKKRIASAVLASAVILSVASCGNSGTTTTASNDTTTTTAAPAAAADTTTAAADAAADTTAADAAPAATAEGGGTTFNIYAWNEEFKGFFEKYMPGYDASAQTLDGVKVNWTITPSDGGAYQDKLDQALQNNASASADDKVDMFLAEADYILKYTDSDYTMDISEIGLKQVDTEYQYTVSAASDSNGKIKGVSFQCCPAALIYRRSIAKDVLGTDDPAEVQAQLDSWDKYEEAAAKAKDKGYYIQGSYAANYRVFSNNATSAWVSGGQLTIPAVVEQWTDQVKKFYDNGYILDTLPTIWEAGNTAQMFNDGKTMCFFGPAWYYNFSMGNAQDPDKGCYGDWGICQGPAPHFWGGTWILAATGTDNGDLVAKVMQAFTENEEVLTQLVEVEGQYTNNSAINDKYADDPTYGNDFLGGQNDFAVYKELAKNIKFENNTIYDQLCNEGYQDYIKQYLNGSVDKDTALQNFYGYINEKYPAVQTP